MQSFAKQMGDIGAIITGILSAVFFTMLLVAGNTMAQSVRERTSELAVLKTLGFSGPQVLALVLGESCLLALLGGGIGFALGYLFVSFGDPTHGALPIFFIPTGQIALGIGLILLLGLLTGALPAFQAMRLRIVDALAEKLTMSNPLSQIVAVATMNLKTIGERRGASLATVFGVAGVVAVFVGVLSIGEGFAASMRAGGREDVAMVMRSGNDSEMMSGLPREDTDLIKQAPGVLRDASGPVASAELFVVVDIPKRSTNTGANVPLRGVQAKGLDVRHSVKIVEGRMFEADGTKSSSVAPRRASSRGSTSAPPTAGVRTSGPWWAFSRTTVRSSSRRSGPTRRCCSRRTTAATSSSR
jgi:ABC-type lipoprotein release transport system permease subunit